MTISDLCLHLHIEKPVRPGAERADHDRLGNVLPIFDDLEHCTTKFSIAPSNMDQQQEASAQEPTAPPAVKDGRKTEQQAQGAC